MANPMTFSSYTTDLSHAHLLCYGCGLGEERIEVRRFRLVGRHHDGYLRQSRSDLVGPTIVYAVTYTTRQDVDHVPRILAAHLAFPLIFMRINMHGNTASLLVTTRPNSLDA